MLPWRQCWQGHVFRNCVLTVEIVVNSDSREIMVVYWKNDAVFCGRTSRHCGILHTDRLH